MLDVRLPDGDGITVCRELRSRMPELACLMLTSFDDEDALLDAIMAGAAGYVLKQINGSDLVSAVRTVAAGRSMLDPETTARLMRTLRTPGTAGPGADERLSVLSEREPQARKPGPLGPTAIPAQACLRRLRGADQPLVLPAASQREAAAPRPLMSSRA
ncbi:hypothetical protein SMICM304S_06032 [Streptomyces microflavus]